MSNSVYEINKGINKSIEFQGLKAQYIWYLGGGVFGLLILFGILYVIGVPQLVCVAVVMTMGGIFTFKIFGWSRKYGEHGMMKMMARKRIPKLVKVKSRSLFIKNSD